MGNRCVLDGELVVMINGVPASFVAYDCLQVGERVLFNTPLLERKEILKDLVRENERIAVSRFIKEQGKRTMDWIKYNKEEEIFLNNQLICAIILMEKN